MIRVVIDTNVVVSANLSDEGLPAAILDLAANQRILMCVSTAVLSEYKEVLNRPRLKLAPRRIAQSLAVIGRRACSSDRRGRSPSSSTTTLTTAFWNALMQPAPTRLVTGNTRHFPKAFGVTAIVTPKQFIDLVLPLLAKLRNKKQR